MPAVRSLALLALFLAFAGCRKGDARLVWIDPPRPAPALRAPRSQGAPFELRAEKGKVVLVTFGYTSCPDVCPTTLARLQDAYDALGERVRQVSVVFVSVDPRRDTLRRLEDYVAAFDPRFHAVRLEGVALSRVLTAFGVTARRSEADPDRYPSHPAAQGSYTLDHTGGFVALDPAGRLRLRLPHDATREELLQAVNQLLPAPRTLRVESVRGRRSPAGVGAIYFSLRNDSHEADRLLAVTSRLAGRIELHETVPEGTLLRMVARPDGFALPGRSRVDLEPGGKHLMVQGLGERGPLEIELHFAHAAPLTVLVPFEEGAGR
jgi:protein SCO1/2